MSWTQIAVVRIRWIFIIILYFFVFSLLFTINCKRCSFHEIFVFDVIFVFDADSFELIDYKSIVSVLILWIDAKISFDFFRSNRFAIESFFARCAASRKAAVVIVVVARCERLSSLSITTETSTNTKNFKSKSKIRKTTTIFTTINETKSAFDDIEKKRKRITFDENKFVKSKKMKIIENEKKKKTKLSKSQTFEFVLFEFMLERYLIESSTLSTVNSENFLYESHIRSKAAINVFIVMMTVCTKIVKHVWYHNTVVERIAISLTTIADDIFFFIISTE